MGQSEVSYSLLKTNKYKKISWDKFVKQKRTFYKTFGSSENVLQLPCLVDNLLDDLGLLMFMNATLP